MRSGRSHNSGLLAQQVPNEVFGKAHLRESGSDFEPMINFKERDLIQTLLEQQECACGQAQGHHLQEGKMHCKVSDQHTLRCSRCFHCFLFPFRMSSIKIDTIFFQGHLLKSNSQRAFTRNAVLSQPVSVTLPHSPAVQTKHCLGSSKQQSQPWV